MSAVSGRTMSPHFSDSLGTVRTDDDLKFRALLAPNAPDSVYFGAKAPKNNADSGRTNILVRVFRILTAPFRAVYRLVMGLFQGIIGLVSRKGKKVNPAVQNSEAREHPGFEHYKTLMKKTYPQLSDADIADIDDGFKEIYSHAFFSDEESSEEVIGYLELQLETLRNTDKPQGQLELLNSLTRIAVSGMEFPKQTVLLNKLLTEERLVDYIGNWDEMNLQSVTGVIPPPLTLAQIAEAAQVSDFEPDAFVKQTASRVKHFFVDLADAGDPEDGGGEEFLSRYAGVFQSMDGVEPAALMMFGTIMGNALLNVSGNMSDQEFLALSNLFTYCASDAANGKS